MIRASIPFRAWPTLLLPRFLAGLRFRAWLRLLRHHRWRVDPAFVPRAAVVTVATLGTSLLARFEERQERRLLRRGFNAEAWERPIFILSRGRSGSTHLHGLLARDARFAYASRFDAFHPHTFLTRRRLGLEALYCLARPRARTMDAVQVHWFSPEEDDIAVALLLGLGLRLSAVFPRETAYPQPAEAQTAALRHFMRKLVMLHGKPVVLKSPSHLGRVPSLLAAFPAARFVLLVRNPRDEFRSKVAMLASPAPLWCALQWPRTRAPRAVAANMAKAVATYEAARAMIPSAQQVEVRYEDLVADEAGTLRRIYAALGVAAPTWLDAAAAEAARRGYRRNQPPPLDAEMAAMLREACAPLYARGLYAPPVADDAASR
jgi:hypothetical protein